MPYPNAGESKEAYISRCIPYMIKEEGKEQDQAVAMCHAFWKEYGPGGKEKNEMITDKIDAYLNESSGVIDEIESVIDEFQEKIHDFMGSAEASTENNTHNKNIFAALDRVYDRLNTDLVAFINLAKKM
jgi:hypothetical protein